MEPMYVVLLPVKPPSLGKSRLVGLGDDERRALAVAFALDTAAACLASSEVSQVLVTTDDAEFAGRLGALGCAAVPDGVAGDLNEVLRQTSAEARRRWPDLVPAALLGDLPALDPVDLDEALAAAAAVGGPSYVVDADGSGTTLYTASYDAFDPHFGIGSALAHDVRGAQPLVGGLTTLRRDVDDLDDLRAAMTLGLGERTAEAVRSLSVTL